MSFDFRGELRLRTLKVCNHPADKCYNSVFQRPLPYKSDSNEIKQKGINGLAAPLPGEERVLSNVGEVGMCGPKGYGFSVVLAIMGFRVWRFLAILVIHKAPIVFAL